MFVRNPFYEIQKVIVLLLNPQNDPSRLFSILLVCSFPKFLGNNILHLKNFHLQNDYIFLRKNLQKMSDFHYRSRKNDYSSKKGQKDALFSFSVKFNYVRINARDF